MSPKPKHNTAPALAEDGAVYRIADLVPAYLLALTRETLGARTELAPADLKSINEMDWRGAMALQSMGDPHCLALLLGSAAPIPEFVRRWLIEALAGRVRPVTDLTLASRSSVQLDHYIANVYEVQRVYGRHLLDCQSERKAARLRGDKPEKYKKPSDLAIERAADELRMKPREVVACVHPEAPRRRKTGPLNSTENTGSK